ncbi:MAG: hypothetical protein CMA07_06480 [Euryarchaeota archaeon]|nr:hypothetical protein [Euryarchaeota archaeon]
MSDQEQLNDLSNRVARSTVAVIDTVVQRGGFKGEELTTIGQLRDQAVQVINMVEAAQSTESEVEE